MSKSVSCPCPSRATSPSTSPGATRRATRRRAGARRRRSRPRGSAAGRLPAPSSASRTSSRTTVAASPSMADTICASPPSPGTNDATSRPSRSTVHMSQWARTSARRWEMKSTDRLRSFHRCITAKTRSERSGGRAAVISSSTSSCGSNASALARSSMRRNGSGRSRDLLVEVEAVEVHRGQLGTHRADVGARQAQVLGDGEVGGQRGILEHRRQPGGPGVARPAQLGRRPCRAIVPASARSTPVRILTIVDLPAPLAPSRACASPGRTVRSTARRATTGPNALATAVASRSGVVIAVRPSAGCATSAHPALR